MVPLGDGAYLFLFSAVLLLTTPVMAASVQRVSGYHGDDRKSSHVATQRFDRNDPYEYMDCEEESM